MLSLLIDAVLQNTPPSPQPIYVTIQEPPGIPEWIKILMTAGAGAIVGVLSNLLTETLKPLVTRNLERRKVQQQIQLEMRSNLEALEKIFEVLEKLDLDNDRYGEERMFKADVKAINVGYLQCASLRWNIRSDRYKHYSGSKEFWAFTIDKDTELENAYFGLDAFLRNIDGSMTDADPYAVFVVLIAMRDEAQKAIMLFKNYLALAH